MSEQYAVNDERKDVFSGIVRGEDMLAYGEVVKLLNRTAELEQQLTQHVADAEEAAGELKVDLPLPGTDAAKLLKANMLLKGEVAFLRKVGSLIDGQFGRGSYKAAQELAKLETAFTPVNDWYESDEHEPRPLAEKLTDAVTDLQNDRQQNLKLREQLRAVVDELATFLPAAEAFTRQTKRLDSKQGESTGAYEAKLRDLILSAEALLSGTEIKPESNSDQTEIKQHLRSCLGAMDDALYSLKEYRDSDGAIAFQHSGEICDAFESLLDSPVAESILNQTPIEQRANDSRIVEAESNGGWISVEDRLPEINEGLWEKVLIAWRPAANEKYYVVTADYCNQVEDDIEGTRTGFFNSIHVKNNNVAFWQPFPAPPNCGGKIESEGE